MARVQVHYIQAVLLLAKFLWVHRPSQPCECCCGEGYVMPLPDIVSGCAGMLAAILRLWLLLSLEKGRCWSKE